MDKKKPWKNKVERDIKIAEDVKVSGTQGGRVIGDNLTLFSFLGGIPLLLIGLFGLFNMAFNPSFPMNSATIILVLIILAIGSLLTIGGIFLYIDRS